SASGSYDARERQRAHRSGGHGRGAHGRRAPPSLHAVLHDQGARHGTRPRDRPVGRRRSPRPDLGGERTRPRLHVHDRAASMTRVLIVDDDQTTLASISRTFRMAGYDAVVCDQAARAIALVRGERFDVIFSDVVMPGKDGLSMLADLRELGIATPVIMISGQATVDMAVRATKLGDLDVFEKAVPAAERLLTDGDR